MEDLKYGMVVINSGKYKGQLGLYDDESDFGRAVVYPVATPGKYVCLPHSWLSPLSENVVVAVNPTEIMLGTISQETRKA